MPTSKVWFKIGYPKTEKKRKTILNKLNIWNKQSEEWWENETIFKYRVLNLQYNIDCNVLTKYKYVWAKSTTCGCWNRILHKLLNGRLLIYSNYWSMKILDRCYNLKSWLNWPLHIEKVILGCYIESVALLGG